MKKYHGYWIDGNNNKWSVRIFSKEQATKMSESLIDCYGCSNCTDCSNCVNCSNCTKCSYCTECSYCRYCTDCTNCSECSYCTDCTNCNNCSNCSYCPYCSYCTDFKRNPLRYVTGNIGSRNESTEFYWLDGRCVVNCGCQHGITLDDFYQKVLQTHGDNQYAKQYIKEIEKVLYLIFN